MIKAKTQHYNVVIKPEYLYVANCLALNQKGETEELEKVVENTKEDSWLEMNGRK